MLPSIETPWSRTAEEVVFDLQVDPAQGLRRREVHTRRKQFGANRIQEAKKRSVWKVLIDQFKSIVLLVLVVAAGLAFAVGEWPEGIAVLAVVLINTLIGFTSEWRAIRSMETLRQIGKARVRVRRDGRDQDVSIDNLVPGDVVFQEGGDIVPADLRLIESNRLRVDESALTGESVPVVKRVEPIDDNATLAEQHNILFRGTSITEGSAEGIVVSIGMETQLGQIAKLAEEAKKEATPLQARLDQLGFRLAWSVLGITVVVATVVGKGLRL